MTTEKLFLHDSLALEFEAEITGPAEFEGQPSVLLNRSAFYGQAGGQLGDQGRLLTQQGALVVTDTRIDAQHNLHHILLEPLPAAVSGTVRGEVAFARRRDMMSQHTGQHILSAAFAQLADLDTISARLGNEISTIDLPGTLSQDLMDRVEDFVNDLVLENRPIQPLFPDEAELQRLDLRRKPKVTEDIRLIHIQDFDITPCGGTHCHQTGQVGAIRITGTERYKGNTRVAFVAGKRAITYLRRQDNLLKELGAEYSCGVDEIGDVLNKLRREVRDYSNLLGKTRAELISFLCRQLHDAHPPKPSGPTLIIAVREEDDPNFIRKLASSLTARPDVLALTACRDPKSDGWSVVVERGADCQIHVGNWFRDQSTRLGGRGGGRPERAEGRWPAEVNWSHFSV